MARCEERSGFLFAHDCEEPVAERCSTCNKSVCQSHAHPAAGGLQCTSCAKAAGSKASVAQPPRGQAQGNRAGRRRDRHDDDFWHSSPYLYGGAYYGYGHYGHGYWGSRHMHRDDFTEADGQSLSGGAGEGFEDDIGGS